MVLDFQPIGRYARCSVQKIASGKSLVQARFAPATLKLADVDVLLFYTFALFAVGGIQRFLDADRHAAQRTAFDAVISLHEVNAGELLAVFSC